MYVFIIYKNSQYSNLSNYFKSFNDCKEDIVSLSLNRAYSSLYIAKNAQRDILNLNNIFRGYFIDDEKRRIVFSGNCGACLPEVSKSYRGSYIHISYDEDKIYLKNDLFSIRPIFYYSNSDICIISSSIFLITEIKRACGLKNTLNEEMGISSAWVNGKGAQLIGLKTIVNDLYFAPLNSEITVSLRKPDLVFKINIQGVSNTFKGITHPDDYSQVLKRSGDRLHGLCASLLTQKDFKLKLSLSAGLDSRCCFASLASFANKENLLLYTNYKQKDDFEIVKRFSQKYKFKLNKPHNTIPEPGTALSRWAIANAAKYHVFCDNNESLNNTILRMTGHGGECVKGDFGWLCLNALLPAMADNSKVFNKVDKRYIQQKSFFYRFLNRCALYPSSLFKERARIIYKNQKEVLQKLDIDSTSRSASEYLYTYFRNPCHSGHASYNSFIIFPLLDSDLVGLAHSSGSPWKYPDSGSPSVLTDLLICLNPALAAEPFSNKQLKLDQSHIKERKKVLGEMDFSDPYALIGQLNKSGSGISEIFLKMAEQNSFKGDFSYENWLNLALEAFEMLPASVRKHFEIYIWILLNDFPKSPKEHKWKWHIGGKLLSFLLIKN